MKILALDLGTNTGWAVFGSMGMFSGVEVFTPAPAKRTKKALAEGYEREHAGKRFYKFERFLCGAIQLNDITPDDVVYYEKVCAHNGTTAAHMYGGFEAILQMVCFELNIRCEPVPVGTIKKFATGNGAAKKPLMIKAATQKFGWELTSPTKIQDNEADAICLLQYAMKINGLTSEE